MLFRSNSQDIIRRSLEPLDPAGKYHLEYEINVATKLARFHVAVETKGYVGFGFSPNGGMTGADIVIGGVYDNGFSYFAVSFANQGKIVKILPNEFVFFAW